VIVVAAVLLVSKSRPPTRVVPMAVGWVVKPPLKTAMSLAVVVALPNQFVPVAQVELEVPVHVILVACATGRPARSKAINAG
jgi:hypothetical protein